MTPDQKLALFVGLANILVTAVLALLTGWYVRLTNRLVKAQVEPCVVVFAHADEARPSAIEIVIRNVGNAVAYEIGFSSSEPLTIAWGIEPASLPAPKPMAGGPLVVGIPMLAPGEERRLDWGQYTGIKKVVEDRAIRVKCDFTTGDGGKRTTESVLEIQSFSGTQCFDRDGSRKSAEQLRRIADWLEASERRRA